MLKNTIIFVSMMLLLASFCHADWSVPGYWKLESINHTTTTKYLETNLLNIRATDSTATFDMNFEGLNQYGDGGGSTKIVFQWASPPAILQDKEKISIPFSAEFTQTLPSCMHCSSLLFGAAASIGISSAGCTIDAGGQNYNWPNIFIDHKDEASAKLSKTLEATVPTFEKTFACMGFNKYGYSEEGLREYVKEGNELSFNIKLGAYDGSDSGYATYKYVFVSEGAPTKTVVTGTVFDVNDNPMPYITIQINVGNKVYKGIADENGAFKIELTDVKKKTDAILYVVFTYVRDGKEYLKLYDQVRNSGSYNLVYTKQPITVDPEKKNEVKIVMDGKDDGKTKTSSTSLDDLSHYSVIYHHLHESVDFALVKLKANIDYKLPVEIYLGNADDKTYYNPDNSFIMISTNNLNWWSVNRPKNREYHEFGHHVMYAQYNGLQPSGRNHVNSTPHDGFINPNTADSFVEGFAEWYALVVSEYFKDKNPEVYSEWGSLENNYKAWDAQGRYEEFAVASLLWDLYDKNNEDQDRISLPLEEIWDWLKVNRADFYQYYKALKQKYPSKASDIDALFVEHGVFADTTLGNKKLDEVEPWRYLNRRSGPYEYVDLGCNNDTSKITYKQGMTIGKATNYERSNRSSAIHLSNAYLSVKNNIPNVRFYTVNVHYANLRDGKDYKYLTEQRSGKIYVNPLPGDVDATLTITPNSTAYKAEKPYTISNKQLLNAIFSIRDEKGSYASYDFKLAKTGKEDKALPLFRGVEPRYAYEGDLNTEARIKISEDGREGGNAAIFMVLVVIILGVVIYLVIRKKKK